jgi:hypothetical protein
MVTASMNSFFGSLGRGTSARHVLLAAVLVLPVAACSIDDIVKTKDPDIVLPGQLEGKAALPNGLAAAIGDFQVAFSGTSGTEGQILYSALLGDEFYITDTFGTRIEMDQRLISDNNSNNLPVFSNLQVARTSTEAAAQRYVTLEGTRGNAADTTAFGSGRAEALALAGYTYILFAENYCEGVPFSEVDASGAIIAGTPNSRSQMLRRALARFAAADSALNVKTNTSTSIRNLVRVGRGRAYLDLVHNDSAASQNTIYRDSAALAVAAVPTTFTYLIFHSENTARENNSVWSFNNSQVRFSVSNSEGGNGLPYRTAFVNGVDVRTATNPTAVAGFDGGTTFLNLKYPERKVNVVLASGAEARYIEAEDRLANGNIQPFLDKLNVVRDAFQTYNQCYPLAVTAGTCTNPSAALGPLSDPGTAAARIDMLFRERAYTLWITSHRLGDMRRLIYQYGRTQDLVFPNGAFVRGNISRTYGTDVSFPVPVEEKNNPNFQSCDNSKA